MVRHELGKINEVNASEANSANSTAKVNRKHERRQKTSEAKHSGKSETRTKLIRKRVRSQSVGSA